MTLTQKAYLFALAAHSAIGQTRKYSGEPYIVHPIEVADIVRSVPHTDEMVAAAYLHDVVEDTEIDLEMIREQFGDTVADYVFLLTDTDKSTGLNRRERKQLDTERLARAPAEVQTVKFADFISNTGSIVERDPKFALTYLAEKRAMLAVMTAGDRTLHQRASEIVTLENV